MDEPLAAQWRGEHIESWHSGILALVGPDGTPRVVRGDPATPIYARSTLKPVQALPLLLGGAAAAFGLTDEVLAITCASHSGDARHRAAASTLLAAAGFTESDLQCGTHLPYDEPTARALVGPPTPLYCNCSGKHAGMLAVCRHHGWDPTAYRDPDHPLQRWIRDLLAELSGVPAAAIGHAVDGCGVPVWHLPVQGLALTFARLTTPDGLRPEVAAAARRLTGAMIAHPHLVAGTGRLDTDFIAATGYVAKIGGEGVYAGGIPGAGLGWALKVADGNKRALGPALARALEAAGFDLPDDPKLAPHIAPAVKNNHGAVVGHVRAAW